MNGSSTITLPKDFSLEISGFYYAPSLAGVVVWQDFNNLNIGIQKKFRNNGGTLNFSVNDLFLGANWRGLVDDPNVDFYYEGGICLG